MKISYLRAKIPRRSLTDSTQHDHGDLKQAVKDFLCAASCQDTCSEVCPRCGRQMEHMDVVFSLYGGDGAWNVRLPVCGCATKNPGAARIENDHQNDAMSR